MQSQPYVATYREPVWRDRADFIVAVDISEDAEGTQREQQWTRRIDESRFQICCIPFFAFDLALGDVVEAGTQAGREYSVRHVIDPSGHSTFRVWLGDSPHLRARQEIVDELTRLVVMRHSRWLEGSSGGSGRAPAGAAGPLPGRTVPAAPTRVDQAQSRPW